MKLVSGSFDYWLSMELDRIFIFILYLKVPWLVVARSMSSIITMIAVIWFFPKLEVETKKSKGVEKVSPDCTPCSLFPVTSTLFALNTLALAFPFVGSMYTNKSCYLTFPI